MSFDALQSSQIEGNPVRLYEFTIGTYAMTDTPGDPGYDYPAQQGEAIWRYCDADRELAVPVPGDAGATWTSINIKDGGVSLSGEATADGYEITLPSSAAIALKYRGTPPTQVVGVKVYDVHANDDDLEAQVIWVGEVAEVAFPSPDTAVFRCATLAAAFQRTGLRLTWSKNCPHVLYDKQCGLKVRDFSEPSQILAVVSANVIQIDGNIDPVLFRGGMVYWVDQDGYSDTLGIEEVNGDLLTLFGLTDRLSGIKNIYVVRGCSRTMASCATFNNTLNFGGAPHMPEKNPFDGTPVF